MAINPNAPSFIYAAAQRLYPRLPVLVGEDWQIIKKQADSYMEILETQPNAYLEATQLFGLLAKYEMARLALGAELRLQETVTYNLINQFDAMEQDIDNRILAAIYAGTNWEVDPDTIPLPSDDVRTRSITLKNEGVDGGRSLKFRNLDIDLGKMMTIVAGFLIAGQDTIDKPTPFMVAGGILALVGTLLSEMTVKIEQQEATVFWGFIQATVERPKDRQATTDAIFSMTNTERTKRGLPELERQAFDHSLFKLEQLGSIARVDSETYSIIESFRTKE